MSLSRRELMRLAGGIGLVGAAGSLGLIAGRQAPHTGTLLRSQIPLPEPFRQDLRIPREVDLVAGGRYELTQRAVDAEILPGRRTRIFGYDGTFPGPTVRARSGRPIDLRVRSELPIATTVHLHGGKTPPDSDGYPTDLILPRSGGRQDHGGDATVGERVFHYPLEQPAATLWYHDHAMDFTGPNLYAGLAGFFLVGDDVEDDLPLPGGQRDLPLMICDRAFDGDGQFRYPALSPEQDRPGVRQPYLGGVLGDVILVNGVPWPVHAVARGRYRLRLLNASNARRYRLELDPPPPEGSPFAQIGSDVGLLERPLDRDSITLASAERVEVVVDFSRYPVGTRVTLRNSLGNGPTADVMRFVVARSEPDDSAVPERLATPESLARSRASRVRTFRFSLELPVGEQNGSAGQGGPAHRWTINGETFDPDVDLAAPRLDDVEVWRFMTDVHHPVHIHLAHFRVLSRNGRTPRPGDTGMKDTVDLLPGETCEVITRFTGFRGRYVLHCHNLEHEDMAMMANFTVT